MFEFLPQLNISNISGGWTYHRRAWANSALWQNHLTQTARWLRGWPQSSDTLILVGPSAGYSLPTDFLKNFKTILAFEKDPIAPWLLRRQHPTISVDWRGPWNSESQRSAQCDFPRAQWLFCNILGQLPLERNAPFSQAQLQKIFALELKETSWASYHDLWSTNKTPVIFESWSPQSSDLNTSIRHFMAADAAIEVIDHETANLWPNNSDRCQWIWQITANHYHCIEGVRSSKQDRGA